MQGTAWTITENILTVRSYLRMLLLDWEGVAYNKSAERRALSPSLRQRTDSSIEMKHRNISAILLAHGIPPIYGYKPLPNIQRSLEAVVVEAVANIPQFTDLAIESISAVNPNTEIPTLEIAEVPEVSISWKTAASRRQVIHRDLVAAESRALGVHVAALQAVALHEKRSLAMSNQKDLADAVAVRDFDDRVGVGLVISYSASGDVKTIAVKATNSISEFPFMVTSDEIDLSLDPTTGFHLYRVFGLRHRPSFYTLRGSLKTTAQLTAVEYTGLPRS